jgi:AcrR family transcriptional regulator
MSTSATAGAPPNRAPDDADAHPAERKGERTRQTILDAAVAQFAVVGFRSASVPAIAREVGVSSSAVYAYFSSKTDLFEEAVDADVAGLISDALPEVLVGHFDGDFTRVFARLLGALDAHPLARRVLEGDEASGAERLALLPAELTLQAGIAEALRNGQAGGTVRADIEPELLAAGLEAVVIALLMSLLQVNNRVDSIHARGALAVLDAAIRPSTP